MGYIVTGKKGRKAPQELVWQPTPEALALSYERLEGEGWEDLKVYDGDNLNNPRTRETEIGVVRDMVAVR